MNCLSVDDEYNPLNGKCIYMIKKLNLNLIPVLCALVETQSATEAAKRLGVANSVISYSLGGLRAHYGDPLMVRTGDGMKPTGKALFLYKKFRHALDLIENEEFTGNNSGKNVRKIYRLRTYSIVEVWLINQAVKDNPVFSECTLDFVYPRFTPEQRLDGLRKRFVDLDFGTILDSDHSIVQYTGVTIGAKLVCRCDHSRITGNKIDRVTLMNEKLIHWLSYAELSARSVPFFNNEVIAEMFTPYRSCSPVSLIMAIALSDYIGLIPERLAGFYCRAFNLKILSTDFQLDHALPIGLNVHKDALKDPVIIELTKILRDKFLTRTQS